MGQLAGEGGTEGHHHTRSISSEIVFLMMQLVGAFAEFERSGRTGEPRQAQPYRGSNPRGLERTLKRAHKGLRRNSAGAHILASIASPCRPRINSDAGDG
jgi:hypothetical protein